MLRQEMRIGYFDLIHRPGEKLGVYDNRSDMDCCEERTHCNCTHDSFVPQKIWDEARKQYVLKDPDDLVVRLEKFRSTIEGRRHTILDGGDHNNVYFPGFYHYRDHLPKALMQDIDGHWLELRDRDILGGKPIPMPAIDDPDLLRLYAEGLARQASYMPGCHHVAAYVLGGEVMYPEFFALGKGDYRPTSWAHFESWCREQGQSVPDKRATLLEGSPERKLWLRFREQAMADRTGFYYRAVLNQDHTHLAFHATHGSALYGKSRQGLGQQPDSMSAVCDGIEMGHILIDNDAERRNVILTCLNTSYGKPVIVPRLGNKTADLSAGGGGRSFTPEMLRRLVYEDVGMGISIIFPIHWRSHLHDGEWFIKNTPAETECRRVFDEIVQAAPYMTGMGRLQPQLGILAADDTWLDEWQSRWTALMQDALSDHVHATIISDALIDRALSRRMPMLLLVDDANISPKTLEQLLEYLNGGGKIIVWGKFATDAAPELRGAVLEHPHCHVSQAPVCQEPRVLREMFLTGMTEGTCGVRYRFQGVDYAAIAEEIETFAPEVVLRPFRMEGAPGWVNAYALTDRGGLGCVLINNANEECAFSISPDPRLLTSGAAVDMLTGRSVEMPITLSPHGTRMLYFSPTGEASEELICEAEDAYERWGRLHANRGPMRHNYSGMRSGEHLSKRCALAEALLHTIALRCEPRVLPDGTLEIWVDAFDAKGNPVMDARIDMTMTPGMTGKYVFHAEEGRYVCRVTRNDMARVYNPDTCDYEALSGMARLVLQAENDTLQGGCIEHVKL